MAHESDSFPIANQWERFTARTNQPQNGWDKSDNWKVKKKDRVRMVNPAAKLANKPAGITVEIDKKNGRVVFRHGRRVLQVLTLEQLERLANE